MKLPVSGSTVAQTVRFGSMVASGVAATWAWRSDRKVVAALFAGIGLASVMLTKTVPAGGVGEIDVQTRTDSLEAALKDCRRRVKLGKSCSA